MHNEHPFQDAAAPAPADRRALLASLGGFAAGALLAGTRTANAGPLDPPPGPIAPTGLTLEQLAARTSLPAGIAEPRRPLPDAAGNFTITETGSYYLTQNAYFGIAIFATDVTLDLCGYTVFGGPGPRIIELSNPCQRATIRNGRLDATINTNQFGISNSANAAVTLEDLRIVGNGLSATGIYSESGSIVCRRLSVAGFVEGINALGGVIEDCQLEAFRGIRLNSPSIVRRCAVSVSSQGIRVGANSSVVDCQVLNTGAILPSVSVGNGSLVDQCVISGGNPGIDSGDNCSLLRSVVRGARGIGIDTLAYSRIADCNVSGTTAVIGGDAGIGIRASQRFRLERSIISSNASRGVLVNSFDAAISDCSIVLNGGVGIQCVGPAMIERCHLANNAGGISVDALTRVSQCHLDFNADFGVKATSTGVGGTFISDCDITRHTTGVDIRATSGSGVFRSRFAGNTTDISAPADNFQLKVSGSAAANAATNPNVNISL